MDMHPRRALLVGLVFVLVDAGYVAFATFIEPGPIEPAAVVMLLALAVAMSLMAWVLASGMQNG
jgi:uncharacterized membrane protein (DUF485 family)